MKFHQDTTNKTTFQVAICPIISLLGCFLCLAGDEIARTMEKGNQIHRIHIFQGEHDRQGEAFCHAEFCIVTELYVSSR